ncbi:MAG: hypothetical protein LBB11_03220 [Puniceicoccales bacterium]|nr:hypothetical protein [Puniceicoccales bacterium]
MKYRIILGICGVLYALIGKACLGTTTLATPTPLQATCNNIFNDFEKLSSTSFDNGSPISLKQDGLYNKDINPQVQRVRDKFNQTYKSQAQSSIAQFFQKLTEKIKNAKELSDLSGIGEQVIKIGNGSINITRCLEDAFTKYLNTGINSSNSTHVSPYLVKVHETLWKKMQEFSQSIQFFGEAIQSLNNTKEDLSDLTNKIIEIDLPGTFVKLLGHLLDVRARFIKSQSKPIMDGISISEALNELYQKSLELMINKLNASLNYDTNIDFLKNNKQVLENFAKYLKEDETLGEDLYKAEKKAINDFVDKGKKMLETAEAEALKKKQEAAEAEALKKQQEELKKQEEALKQLIAGLQAIDNVQDKQDILGIFEAINKEIKNQGDKILDINTLNTLGKENPFKKEIEAFNNVVSRFHKDTTEYEGKVLEGKALEGTIDNMPYNKWPETTKFLQPDESNVLLYSCLNGIISYESEALTTYFSFLEFINKIILKLNDSDGSIKAIKDALKAIENALEAIKSVKNEWNNSSGFKDATDIENIENINIRDIIINNILAILKANDITDKEKDTRNIKNIYKKIFNIIADNIEKILEQKLAIIKGLNSQDSNINELNSPDLNKNTNQNTNPLDGVNESMLSQNFSTWLEKKVSEFIGKCFSFSEIFEKNLERCSLFVHTPSTTDSINTFKKLQTTIDQLPSTDKRRRRVTLYKQLVEVCEKCNNSSQGVVNNCREKTLLLPTSTKSESKPELESDAVTDKELQKIQEEADKELQDIQKKADDEIQDIQKKADDEIKKIDSKAQGQDTDTNAAAQSSRKQVIIIHIESRIQCIVVAFVKRITSILINKPLSAQGGAIDVATQGTEKELGELCKSLYGPKCDIEPVEIEKGKKCIHEIRDTIIELLNRREAMEKISSNNNIEETLKEIQEKIQEKLQKTEEICKNTNNQEVYDALCNAIKTFIEKHLQIGFQNKINLARERAEEISKAINDTEKFNKMKEKFQQLEISLQKGTSSFSELISTITSEGAPAADPSPDLSSVFKQIEELENELRQEAKQKAEQIVNEYVENVIIKLLKECNDDCKENAQNTTPLSTVLLKIENYNKTKEETNNKITDAIAGADFDNEEEFINKISTEQKKVNVLEAFFKLLSKYVNEANGVVNKFRVSVLKVTKSDDAKSTVNLKATVNELKKYKENIGKEYNNVKATLSTNVTQDIIIFIENNIKNTYSICTFQCIILEMIWNLTQQLNNDQNVKVIEVDDGGLQQLFFDEFFDAFPENSEAEQLLNNLQEKFKNYKLNNILKAIDGIAQNIVEIKEYVINTSKSNEDADGEAVENVKAIRNAMIKIDAETKFLELESTEHHVALLLNQAIGTFLKKWLWVAIEESIGKTIKSFESECQKCSDTSNLSGLDSAEKQATASIESLIERLKKLEKAAKAENLGSDQDTQVNAIIKSLFKHTGTGTTPSQFIEKIKATKKETTKKISAKQSTTTLSYQKEIEKITLSFGKIVDQYLGYCQGIYEQNISLVWKLRRTKEQMRSSQLEENYKNVLHQLESKYSISSASQSKAAKKTITSHYERVQCLEDFQRVLSEYLKNSLQIVADYEWEVLKVCRQVQPSSQSFWDLPIAESLKEVHKKLDRAHHQIRPIEAKYKTIRNREYISYFLRKMKYESASIAAQGKVQCTIIYFIGQIIYGLNCGESIMAKKDGDDNKKGDNMKKFQKIIEKENIQTIKDYLHKISNALNKAYSKMHKLPGLNSQYNKILINKTTQENDNHLDKVCQSIRNMLNKIKETVSHMTYSEIAKSGVTKVKSIDKYGRVTKDKNDNLPNAMKALACALGDVIQNFEEWSGIYGNMNMILPLGTAASYCIKKAVVEQIDAETLSPPTAQPNYLSTLVKGVTSIARSAHERTYSDWQSSSNFIESLNKDLWEDLTKKMGTARKEAMRAQLPYADEKDNFVSLAHNAEEAFDLAVQEFWRVFDQNKTKADITELLKVKNLWNLWAGDLRRAGQSKPCAQFLWALSDLTTDEVQQIVKNKNQGQRTGKIDFGAVDSKLLGEIQTILHAIANKPDPSADADPNQSLENESLLNEFKGILENGQTQLEELKNEFSSKLALEELIATQSDHSSLEKE